MSEPSQDELVPADASGASGHVSQVVSILSEMSVSRYGCFAQVPDSHVWSIESSTVHFIDIIVDALFFFTISLFASLVESSVYPSVKHASASKSEEPINQVAYSTHDDS